jgi:hypothetical protein
VCIQLTVGGRGEDCIGGYSESACAADATTVLSSEQRLVTIPEILPTLQRKSHLRIPFLGIAQPTKFTASVPLTLALLNLLKGKV